MLDIYDFINDPISKFNFKTCKNYTVFAQHRLKILIDYW